MTDKTKRIISKLHLSILTVFIFIASLVSIYAAIGEIHDAIKMDTAEKCVTQIFDTDFTLKYHHKKGVDKDGVASSFNDFDEIMKLEDSQEYQLHEQASCGVSKFGDNKYIDGWMGNQKLFQVILSEDRIKVFSWIVMLWVIPLMLIGLKQWLTWLTK